MINPKTKKKLLDEYFKVWGHLYGDRGMSILEIAQTPEIASNYMAKEEINDIAEIINSPTDQKDLAETFEDEFYERLNDRNKYLTGSLYSYDEIMLSGSLALILLKGNIDKHCVGIRTDMLDSRLYADRIVRLLG